MNRAHDRGGVPDDTPIDMREHEVMDWERRVDAVHAVLGSKGLRGTDQMRRAIESLSGDQYKTLSYYERWTAALEILILEKGIITKDEIDKKMSQDFAQ
jgi:hypothetical protein